MGYRNNKHDSESSDSFERRLKLENAVMAISLMNAKIAQQQRGATNNGQDKSNNRKEKRR
jgi:hypothetical protein